MTCSHPNSTGDILQTRFIAIALTTLLAIHAANADERREVVQAGDVEWEPLNPARGDAGPQAATLWGDRQGTVATGFLARFANGFSSPPHIHNATYRAVVISGSVHNDDPAAAHMWMGAGSFWTQPQGESHITAAKGPNTIALVEIDRGPYLVKPIEEAFDSGERPINVDARNIVWVDPPGMPASATGPKVAYLWGSLNAGQANGTFVKLPRGFSGAIRSHGATFRAVVITGQAQYLGDDVKTLEPGSYFGASEEAVHRLSSGSDVETTLYVRTDGRYEIVPAK